MKVETLGGDAAISYAKGERWPAFAEDEISAAVECLRTGRVNQWTGDRVDAFEAAYGAYLNGRKTVAVANGSLALELALRAFGLGPGDEVVVTPRSFVASAFCVMLVGATPVFADVALATGNITAQSIAAVLTPKTRAIIPVHLGGWPVDMAPIMALANERSLLVIEDCAQAHGAWIDGQPVGTFGHAAAFSFCQDKIISTGGEGGLAVFRDDEAAYEWAWSFKDHGKNRVRARDRHAGPGFRWLHDRVGTNWRMTEMSAAIGLAQLAKLADWRLLRERNARLWQAPLTGIDGLVTNTPGPDVLPAYYRLYCRIDRPGDAALVIRDEILAEAGSRGIRLFSGSCSEVYRERAFAELAQPQLPNAGRLGETSLAFEVHPMLDPERLEARAAIVADIVRGALS